MNYATYLCKVVALSDVKVASVKQRDDRRWMEQAVTPRHVGSKPCGYIKRGLPQTHTHTDRVCQSVIRHIMQGPRNSGAEGARAPPLFCSNNVLLK